MGSRIGMVIGMATKKVTITLEEDQLEAIRALVASGTTPSVSGFVQHAVRISLEDVAEFDAMLEASLDATGGPITDEERRWADEVLGIKPRTRRKRSPAA
jgi:Arc/MetJ-type ribon-helix-helix transcriptional regulator